jgi:hypothetical protein
MPKFKFTAQYKLDVFFHIHSDSKFNVGDTIPICYEETLKHSCPTLTTRDDLPENTVTGNRRV